MDANKGDAMSRPSWFQKLYWSNFAKPVTERALFRALLQGQFASVLEIGVGDGARMRRIARLVSRPDESQPLRYVGTDEFESATDGGRHLSLKQTHQLAGQLGLKATLIPGDATSALPRVAHKIGAADLVIIDGGISLQTPRNGPIGNWLDHIAHAQSTVLACSQPGETLVELDVCQLGIALPVAA